MDSVYEVKLLLNDGTLTDFSRFRGQVVLVVNVASECGLTPQYAGLELLYNKFRDQGFLILGVPSNDFGSQEPGNDQQIAEFCERNFQVTFPLLSKSVVKGPGIHPLYSYLIRCSDKDQQDVKWNFEKFLVGRNGTVLARFEPTTDPISPHLITAIETAI
ncbi:glutathione peroxidase [Arthrobacter sp. NPDC055585]